ncbi:MAG: hypothetical protein GX442_09850, partial [Candidatus Riflebacteria bacterium]|nr:hypothetical protein [Candidatus Riflebacteria bacterium]
MRCRHLVVFWLVTVILAWSGTGAEACQSATCDDLYFGRINGFPSDEITAVAVDRKGTVYVGTEDKGLIIIRPDGKSWIQITHKREGLSFDAIHDIWIGQDGTVWVCTASGLNYLPANTQAVAGRKFFFEDGLADNVCLSVCQRENASELWVGTSRGLVRKDGAGFTRYTDHDGLPANLVQCLGTDAQGGLWVGTSDGLARAKFTRFEKVPLDEAQGVTDPWIYAMAWGDNQDKEFLEKIKATYKAMLKGLGLRDKRLYTIDSGRPHEEIVAEVKGLLAKLPGPGNERPLYIATANGAFVKQLGSDRIDLARPGWFTAVTSNALGQGYGALDTLDVVPISFSESFMENFAIGQLIEQRIRAHLAALALDPDNPAFASTTAVLREVKEQGFDDPELWIQAFLSNKRISDITFSPLGQLWVAVKGGGLFRFRPIYANHDSGAFAIQFFHRFGLGAGTSGGGDGTGDGTSDGTGAGEPPAPPPPPAATGSYGFRITTPQREFPQVPQVINGIAMVRSIVPQAEKIWVGRWAELSLKECELVGEFVGRWGFDLCLLRLAQTLAEDPYVIL